MTKNISSGNSTQRVTSTQINDCIKYSINKTEKLTNGDNITISLDVDVDKLYELGFEVNKEKVNISVANLKEISTFNPFEYLEINYLGVDPYTKVRISVKDKEKHAILKTMEFYTYEYSHTTDDYYSNGEKIKVYVDSYFVSNALEQGYKIEPTEKIITVQNDRKWVTQKDMITEDSITEIRVKAKEFLNKEIASWDKSRSAKDIQYEGGFLTIDDKGEENALIIVYSCNVVCEKYEINEKVYFGVKTKKVYVDKGKIRSENESLTFISDGPIGDGPIGIFVQGSTEENRQDIISKAKESLTNILVAKFGNVENW